MVFLLSFESPDLRGSVLVVYPADEIRMHKSFALILLVAAVDIAIADGGVIVPMEITTSNERPSPMADLGMPLQFQAFDRETLFWPRIDELEKRPNQMLSEKTSKPPNTLRQVQGKASSAKTPDQVSTSRFDTDSDVTFTAIPHATLLTEPSQSDASSAWIWLLCVFIGGIGFWLACGIVRVYPGESIRIRSWLGAEEVAKGPGVTFRPWPVYSTEHVTGGPHRCQIHVVPLTADGFRPELSVCILYTTENHEVLTSMPDASGLVETLVRSSLTMAVGELPLRTLVSRQRDICQQVFLDLQDSFVEWGVLLQSIEIVRVGRIGMSSAQKILRSPSHDDTSYERQDTPKEVNRAPFGANGNASKRDFGVVQDSHGPGSASRSIGQ